MSCKCDSCIYRASDSAWNKCDYMLIKEHSRGCEPGNNCTECIKGKRLTLNTNKHMNISKARSADENYLDKFTTSFN